MCMCVINSRVCYGVVMTGSKRCFLEKKMISSLRPSSEHCTVCSAASVGSAHPGRHALREEFVREHVEDFVGHE